jgi:glycosyltransferase involved in cell wall biosynthesis
VFCLPSHHEPFGIVLIEAMAQAVPIVATDSEGPSEILRDGDGILVPRGDAGRLAQALGRLIADPDHAAKLAASAYRRAREEFTMTTVAARIDVAVRRIVRTAPKRPMEVMA